MKEHLLQQLWNSRRFEQRELKSLCGCTFRLLDSGRWNSGDGPDFRLGWLKCSAGARSLELRGDIELHVHEADWQQHGHSADEAYNAVILHVFLFPGSVPVRLQSGAEPMRLCLKPYFRPSELNPQQDDAGLRCAPKLSWISEKVMADQLERARREYFEAKTRDLMQEWNPERNITQAWRALVLSHLADGLGISRNRAAMKRLVGLCLPQLEEATAVGVIQRQLRLQSGLFEAKEPRGMKRSEWDMSGSRPGNKPSERITQLGHIWAVLAGASRRQILKNPESVWGDIIGQSGLSKKRGDLLYLIVWLPACYLLGSALHAKMLASYAYERWTHHQYAAEQQLQQPFIEAGFPPELAGAHLGTVHQLRSYCRAGKCGTCRIGSRLGGLDGEKAASS